MRHRSSLKCALIAGALGLAASSANAQGYYASYAPPGYQAPSESVEVTAPRFHEQHTRLNAPLDKVSLSTAVSFGDLDLRTRFGARELHRRIWVAAQNVCGELRDAYPVYKQVGTSCIKTAYEDGIVRARSEITAARVAWRQSYW
jgi:UrcA family protein